MNTCRALLLAPLAVVTLAACGDGNDGSTASEPAGSTAAAHTLSGEIMLEGADGPLELPDGALIRVTLDDISLQDAPAVTIAEQEIDDASTLPVSYQLEWDEDLEPRNMYAVSVTIRVNDELVYLNDTVHPVEDGDTAVDIAVIAV